MKRALPLCLLAACSPLYDPCFLPASLVSDLRILAVRVDPPEVLYDPRTFAAPSVHVRALVADPGSPFNTNQVYVRACIPASDGRCPAGQAWDASAPGSEALPADLSLHVPAERIRAAREADPLRGYGGVRLQLEILARNSDGTVVTASKLMLYSPALPGYLANQAFSLTGFEAVSETGAGSLLPDEAVLELPVSHSVGLRPLLSPGAAEVYEVRDLAGRTVQLRERISYSFFTLPHAQYGPLGRPVAGSDVADEPLPGDPAPGRGLVTLISLAQADGRIWVVARDGRGAEAWASLALAMPDRRGCSPDVRCSVLDFGCQ